MVELGSAYLSTQREQALWQQNINGINRKHWQLDIFHSKINTMSTMPNSKLTGFWFAVFLLIRLVNMVHILHLRQKRSAIENKNCHLKWILNSERSRTIKWFRINGQAAKTDIKSVVYWMCAGRTVCNMHCAWRRKKPHLPINNVVLWMCV